MMKNFPFFFFFTCDIGFQEPSEIRILTSFLQMNISGETTPYHFSDTWNSCSPRSEELIHISKVTGFYHKPCEVADMCGEHWEILTLAEDLTALLEGLLQPDHSVSFPLNHPHFQCTVIYSFCNSFLSSLITNCHITTTWFPWPTFYRVLDSAPNQIVQSRSGENNLGEKKLLKTTLILKFEGKERK